MNRNGAWVVRLILDSSTRDNVKANAAKDRRTIGNYISKVIEEAHRIKETAE